MDIATVICPVLVTYHADEKTFSIDRESIELAEKSVAGLESVSDLDE